MNTNTKSAWNYIVSQNHIIPSPLANRLGVPVFRTLIADMLIRFRRFKNCRPKDDFENQLIKNGIVVIPNFLPDEEFKELKNEFDNNISSSENVETVRKGSMKINIREVNKNDYEIHLIFENYFLSEYLMSGVVYQRLIFEDALENQRVDFWVYPHLMASQVGEENLEVFFDNNLESQNYGFGLQTGLVINRKLRLVFLLNQFLSYSVRETTGIPVLRFSLGYRFRT